MSASAGKIAVVTGAAQGIGRAIALRLAADGADIALLDLDGPAVRSVAQEIETLGRRALPLETDMLDRAAIAGAFATIASTLGPADILVNNVGQSARERAAPFWEARAETADFLLRICLHTAMDASREAVPAMRSRNTGRIINISSDSAFVGSKSSAAYAAAKAGLIGFTRSLSRELAGNRITVNAIAPGYIRTRAMELLPAAFVHKAIEETPLGMLGEPSDIAHAVAFFASDAARYVTGQTLIVNGGRWMN
ncbi:SDR family NAD(P)-dependent oxidoreductase [Sphingomonas azotifigens]|uniref:SDR family NAD(P)-dependent oxidoreductase n=1 Tax=Sphingomonas azotifigens TaxID=330920 RepID=UPI000A063587|nr:SDR family NAD(P)-dependent oxidoreductase [Sphingomonas azotifigens]